MTEEDLRRADEAGRGREGVRRRNRLLLVVAVLVALGSGSACASTGEGGSSSLGQGDITPEELVGTSVNDAMEAISLLRPQWLRARPSRTINDPVPVVGVVIDGMARGSRADLAQIAVGLIERISFMNAADATIRYGTGFTGGAIVVTTRR